MTAETVHRWSGSIKQLGLETGSTTPWLAQSLKALGLPVVVMDARRASDAMDNVPFVIRVKKGMRIILDDGRRFTLASLLRRTKKTQRIQAVYHALSDLDKQAQRMVREIAKRRAAKPGPQSVPPLRYGNPPGHRKRPIHEVDGILHECHMIAMRMMERASPVGV